MSKKAKRTFDSGALVRAMARERIGQPRPTAILVDKRREKRTRDVKRELRAAIRESSQAD